MSKATRGFIVQEKDHLQINKALQGYLKNLGTIDLEESRASGMTLEDFLSDRMLIVHSIRQGLPFSLFKTLKSITPFSESDWAEFLDISTKSLQRYQNERKHVFKSSQSEKIIELAEVAILGLEVFGSEEKFYRWLKTPSFAIGNMKPVELLKDSYGKEMVMNELNRIDQGIFV
ncbi:MAG: DUF2384 domain-containing protein [Bacteroidia bacterium]|nr:DUF2384 domain-containing protein [Bacteroidia bacterium]